MPAKKSAKKTAKKSAKKTVKKAAAKTAKTTKKRSAGAGKSQATETKAKTKKKAEIIKKDLVDCVHCEGTGRCSTGQPYDKDRHQSIFQEVLLISCVDCLKAAGKSRKSKKMVKCRFCQGTGKVEKTE